MADGSKKASGLGMADGSKKASGLGVKPGDLIEISRKCGLYEHWALCVSDDEVVHIVKLSFTKARIKREKLETVVGSDQWRVNNRSDEKNGPRDIQPILEKAQEIEDTEVFYNFFLNNCEHMVTDLRYGSRNSLQVWFGLIHVLLTGVIVPITSDYTVHYWKKQREESRQGSSTGPTKQKRELVSKEEAKPPHAEGHQRSSTGPKKDGGETVSKEDDGPQYAEALVLGLFMAVIVNAAVCLCRQNGKKPWQKSRQRSSTGPMGEGGEKVSKEEAKPSHADTTTERAWVP